MAASTSTAKEEHNYIFAEEMVKHVLLKDFGIYWEPDPQVASSTKLALKDFYTSCLLLGEAVTTGWKKFYAAIEQESLRIHKSLDGSVIEEKIYAGLKDVARNINLPDEFIFFIVMAVFGELCVRITKSGSESLISNAVSAAKKYIVDEGLISSGDLQMNSIQFMEFCDISKNS